MYVCLCKGITDGHIRQAVAGGARSMRELRKRLDVCGGCGRCGEHAREVLSTACSDIPARAVHIELPASTEEPIWSAA
ncbi:MAG: bacterioferritin-associated ferredoxin [Aquisalimonadaceae bacterium]